MHAPLFRMQIIMDTGFTGLSRQFWIIALLQNPDTHFCAWMADYNDLPSATGATAQSARLVRFFRCCT